MWIHYSEKHMNRDDVSVICICEKVFNTKSAFNQHVKKFHNTPDGKRFKNPKKFKEGKKIDLHSKFIAVEVEVKEYVDVVTSEKEVQVNQPTCDQKLCAMRFHYDRIVPVGCLKKVDEKNHCDKTKDLVAEAAEIIAKISFGKLNKFQAMDEIAATFSKAEEVYKQSEKEFMSGV